MAFTDRFIKVPIKVFSTREKELTGKENACDTWMKIYPFEIASYRPCFAEEYVDDADATIVVLKSGDSTTVYLTPDEFEKLLNDSQK